MDYFKRFTSDFYLGNVFKPIDPKTPEGKEELSRHLKEALICRCRPPSEKKQRMSFSFDRNGIFSKPIIAENVIVCCDRLDAHTKDMCKKFCELYLKTDDGSNSMTFASHADFEKKESYRAAIWVRESDESLPFDSKGRYHGECKGKPVYIMDRFMIESCRGQDMDSPYVLVRLGKVRGKETAF